MTINHPKPEHYSSCTIVGAHKDVLEFITMNNIPTHQIEFKRKLDDGRNQYQFWWEKSQETV